MDSDRSHRPSPSPEHASLSSSEDSYTEQLSGSPRISGALPGRFPSNEFAAAPSPGIGLSNLRTKIRRLEMLAD
jgi:hypothetical protein